MQYRAIDVALMLAACASMQAAKANGNGLALPLQQNAATQPTRH